MPNTTTLTPGTVVRITRTNPAGKTHFIKSGTVGPAITQRYFEFTENIDSTHPGKHVYVCTDQDVAANMRGWTQQTVVLSA